MAESIGDLSLILRGSAEGLAADINRDLKAAESSIQAKAVAMGVLIADGIKAGISGIANLIKGAVNLGFDGLDRIDSLDEAAGKVGLTYNAFQDLKYAVESAGGSVEALSSSLVKMQSNIASGKAEDAFELLKLDLAEIKKLEPDKQFAEITEKLSKLSSTAEKIDLTKEIFGKGGVELMNVINNGKEGLAEVSQLVESLGGHLREADVAMVGMANDNMDKLKAGWGFVKDQIAVGIAPVLTVITQQLVLQAEKVGGIGNLVKQWVGYAVNFSGALLTAAQIAGAIGSLFVTAGNTIGALIATTQAGFKVAFEAAKVGIEEIKIGLKRLAVVAADSFFEVFNSLKNSGLKTINELTTAARLVGVEMKRLNPFADKGALDTEELQALGDRVTYDPRKSIPDMPTGDAPGGPSSLLFPDGVPIVDYTALNASMDEAGAVAIAANDEILKSGQETNAKLTDLAKGNFWGDSYRQKVSDAMAANLKEVENAQGTADALVDIDREAALGKKETLDWFEKATFESFKKMGKQLYEWQQANERTMEQFRSLNRDVVGDLVTSWATGTGKISDIISQWSNNMIRQFVQLSLFGNKSAGGTITGLVGSLFGGLGSTKSATAATGATTAATGAGWASAIGSIFGGFFAGGGRPPMGKVSVVGEHGAELWKPDSSGTIIPNNQAAAFLGGGGGGGGGAVNVAPPVMVTIHQAFSTGVTQADLAGAMDQLQDATMSAVYEGVRRGGGYRKGMQA